MEEFRGESQPTLCIDKLKPTVSSGQICTFAQGMAIIDFEEEYEGGFNTPPSHQILL